MTRPEQRHQPDWLKAYNASTWAVDNYLSNVETLLIALSQRAFTDEQLERLARILQTGERDVLARSTKSAAKGRRRVRAA